MIELVARTAFTLTVTIFQMFTVLDGRLNMLNTDMEDFLSLKLNYNV